MSVYDGSAVRWRGQTIDVGRAARQAEPLLDVFRTIARQYDATSADLAAAWTDLATMAEQAAGHIVDGLISPRTVSHEAARIEGLTKARDLTEKSLDSIVDTLALDEEAV